VDPDSIACVDSESGSGSMGKKNEEKMHFSNIFIAKRWEIPVVRYKLQVFFTFIPIDF
jgi:hypothetical protein